MPKLKNITAQEFADAKEKIEEAIYAVIGLTDRVEKKYFDALPEKQFDRDLLNLVRHSANLMGYLQGWRTIDEDRADLEKRTADLKANS